MYWVKVRGTYNTLSIPVNNCANPWGSSDKILYYVGIYCTSDIRYSSKGAAGGRSFKLFGIKGKTKVL